MTWRYPLLLMGRASPLSMAPCASLVICSGLRNSKKSSATSIPRVRISLARRRPRRKASRSMSTMPTLPWGCATAQLANCFAYGPTRTWFMTSTIRITRISLRLASLRASKRLASLARAEEPVRRVAIRNPGDSVSVSTMGPNRSCLIPTCSPKICVPMGQKLQGTEA